MLAYAEKNYTNTHPGCAMPAWARYLKNSSRCYFATLL